MFIAFYIPFYYSFKTRFRTKIKLLSWFLIYVIPLLSITFIYSSSEVSASLINIILFYTIYEVGYIFNDTYTIKKESSPTLRLSKNQLDYCEKNIIFICIFRLITSIFLLFVLKSIGFNWIYSLSVVTLIALIYCIYNSIRNKINLLLHFLLVNLRYTAVVIPFLSLYEILIVIFIFPIINLLERASEPRFGLTYFQKFLLSNKESGRYIYYLILSIALIILNGIYYPLFWISFYYFIFRLFSSFMVRKQ
ncbi:WbuO protein [Providencia alcalifaciens Dmel2]|nr:WbuO protein [Providencia alcalifaciens Dmel2]